MKLYRFTTYQAGLIKCSLPVENDGSAAFSYSEKGVKIDGKPSIVFVHGFSSNKETWLPIVKVKMRN
jgi:pimeloyl-ACP methyl ester carboxylesterase